MPALRALLLAVPLLVLAACSATDSSSGGEATGVWAGTAEFQVDSLLADQNFRVITDYETTYEFELTQDEDGLILGYLNEYNTGTFTLREPRQVGGEEVIIEETITWDGDLVRSWPVYGTYDRPTLELDIPQAEADEVFPKDLWTFTVVGGRARLEATQILHGYTFSVFENFDNAYTIVLSPTNDDEFSIERR